MAQIECNEDERKSEEFQKLSAVGPICWEPHALATRAMNHSSHQTVPVTLHSQIVDKKKNHSSLNLLLFRCLIDAVKKKVKNTEVFFEHLLYVKGQYEQLLYL